MADLKRMLRASWAKITGGDEAYVADVAPNSEGSNALSVDGTVRIESSDDNPTFTRPRNVDSDAFGRLRVSNPRNVFQYVFRDEYDFDIYWDTKLENGATTQQIDQRVVRELAVTTTTGSRAVLQSRRYMEYYAGKSHVAKYTANFKGAQDGVIKCHGMYDDNNGIFFQVDGTTLYCVIRSDVSGSVVDTRIAQANWSGDKLDGTDTSGHTANPDNKYVFWFDYAWLSIGSVRFGVYIDGVPVIIHEEFPSGNQADSYMRSSQLPFRTEIEVTGSPVSVDSIEVTCLSLEVEGDPADIARSRSLASEYTDIQVGTNENIVALFRINPNSPYSSVKMIETLITVNSGNSTVHWELFLNPTLSGPAPTWVDSDSSCVQYASNATSLLYGSGGFMFADGYARVNDDSRTEETISDIHMGRDIDGNSDIVALVAGTLSSNSRLCFVQSWKEYR